MSGQLEKLLCSQCGGNDLKPFGNAAYKCESCGTILRDEPDEKKIASDHFVAPVSNEFTNSIERKPSYYVNSEERYGGDIEEKIDNMDGDSFIKSIVIIGVLGLVGILLAYFLS